MVLGCCSEVNCLVLESPGLSPWKHTGWCVTVSPYRKLFIYLFYALSLFTKTVLLHRIIPPATVRDLHLQQHTWHSSVLHSLNHNSYLWFQLFTISHIFFLFYRNKIQEFRKLFHCYQIHGLLTTDAEKANMCTKLSSYSGCHTARLRTVLQKSWEGQMLSHHEQS